jgi:hypothetical protein
MTPEARAPQRSSTGEAVQRKSCLLYKAKVPIRRPLSRADSLVDGRWGVGAVLLWSESNTQVMQGRHICAAKRKRARGQFPRRRAGRALNSKSTVQVSGNAYGNDRTSEV